jgi:5-formyltetrahydrofolate cyclo-ligase
MDLAFEKSAARAEALARRARYDPGLGFQLADHVLETGVVPKGAIVAGFWPLGSEINIVPLLTGLAARGHQLCLPVTPKRGETLVFHGWRPGDALVEGRFKTMHPQAGHPMIPDVILTPLLAYTRFGDRLGYGGGYYDRSFAALPEAFRLGCAFSAQQCDDIPRGRDDIKLHAIATERGVKEFDAFRDR